MLATNQFIDSWKQNLCFSEERINLHFLKYLAEISLAGYFTEGAIFLDAGFVVLWLKKKKIDDYTELSYISD